MHEARYCDRNPDGTVSCRLCPHHCSIPEGKAGRCRVRRNQGGTLYCATYARVSSAALDPIEKKPLYHFFPGTSILSLGSLGCNFTCSFCQNHHLSQDEAPLSELPPEAAVTLAQKHGSGGIAFTYNEPLVGFEYVLDTARLARDAGLKNVLVTNGYVNPEPLEELLPVIDALNIDLKSMDEDFYQRLCGGRLAPVLETCRRALRTSHVEITNLLIPGENDRPEQIARLIDWVATELGPDTPLHFSAYHPDYRMDRPPTPTATLLRAWETARARLHFVFVGNLRTEQGADTRCPACGELLIRRSGWHVEIAGLVAGKCRRCQTEIPVRGPNK